MNKIEQIRDEKAKEWENTADQYNETFLWKTGFDACLALELLIKFTEWKDKNVLYFPNNRLLPYQFNNDTWTLKSIYQYWLDNIYKGE